MRFLWLTQQTAIISLHSISRLVLVKERRWVFCEVETWCLTIVQMNFRLRRVERCYASVSIWEARLCYVTTDVIDVPHSFCSVFFQIRVPISPSVCESFYHDFVPCLLALVLCSHSHTASVSIAGLSSAFRLATWKWVKAFPNEVMSTSLMREKTP